MTTSQLLAYLSVAAVSVAAVAVAVWVAVAGAGRLDAAELAPPLIGTHVAVAVTWWMAGHTLR